MMNHVNVQLGNDIFYLSMITIAFAFILLLVALVTFKKPVAVDADNSSMKLGVELAWALIPFVMLFVMLIPIIRMVMQ